MDDTNFKIPTEFNTEIYRTLNDIENLIYFKWNVLTDTLEFTASVENSEYALPQIASPASTLFFGGATIHPDDIEKFENFFNEMFWMQGIRNDYHFFSAKIRLLGKNRKDYLWAEFRLLLYFDEHGPAMAFGCICNINVKQLWQMELQHSAEHDVLTGFLNKTATQKHIEEYLAQLSPLDRPPALIFVDADGFKAINDSFGHLFGDGVLSDMGLAIRSVFRQKDIVGRMGGDEFIILLCEMPSIEVLEKRCTELLTNLDRNYENNDVSLPFSISIGVALYPEHGTTYTELFKHADRALYESKSRGKNQYTIYHAGFIGSNFAVESNRDPTHSEDIRQRAFEDNMLEFILSMLYETQNPEMTISVCLELFGKQFNLDRVTIDKFSRISNRYFNLFEWVSPNGLSLGDKTGSKNFSRYIEKRYALIESGFRPSPYGVMSVCPDTRNKYKGERVTFENLKLGAFAHCQISHGGEIIGSVGFETASTLSEFSKEELTKLSIFSVLLGNILLDRRTDKIFERMSRHLQNILDHMQEFIYVVDKDTYEPIFFNSTIRQTLSTAATDQPCHKRFHDFDKPCEGCPLNYLSKDGNEYIDVKLNNWGEETAARAYNIHWEDEMDKSLALIIQSAF